MVLTLFNSHSNTDIVLINLQNNIMSKCLYGFESSWKYCGTLEIFYGAVVKLDDDRWKVFKMKKKDTQVITFFVQIISVLL